MAIVQISNNNATLSTINALDDISIWNMQYLNKQNNECCWSISQLTQSSCSHSYSNLKYSLFWGMQPSNRVISSLAIKEILQQEKLCRLKTAKTVKKNQISKYQCDQRVMLSINCSQSLVLKHQNKPTEWHFKDLPERPCSCYLTASLHHVWYFLRPVIRHGPMYTTARTTWNVI